MTAGCGEATTSLGQRLRQTREHHFVGRAAELALLRQALAHAPEPFSVLYLHGPGGIGKSTLLRHFGDEAASAGRRVVHVDGRLVSPSPARFENAAAAALTDESAVLLVDSFEYCQGLEDWLRNRFLPRLPESVPVILAGRGVPGPQWRADPAWRDLLKVVPLRNLSPDHAVALLSRRGVPPELHESVLSFAGGHPLALRLAAEVAVTHDVAATASWRPSLNVVETLLTQLIGETPSAQHRHALEICAHARTTTEGLLRAALDCDPGPIFAWLRELPFIESDARGLYPHDVVRDALDDDLRWRDPQGYEKMHRRLHSYLLEQALAATGPAVLPAVGAMMYLQRHAQVVRRYFTFGGEGKVYEDPYRPEDRSAVLKLAVEAEGADSAAIVDFWLSRQPDGCYVYRSSDTDEVVAFLTWLRLTDPDPAELDVDPVVAAAWRHCRSAAPLRGGEHIGLARFMVHPPAYQRPSAVNDLMQMRMLAHFLHDKGLATHYLVLQDVEFWAQHLAYFDDHPAGTPPQIGGRPYHVFFHDWRVTPVMQWLAHNQQQLLYGLQPRPPLAGADLLVLSRPEFDAAVRSAMRAWRRPDELAANPLTRSRLVADHGGGDRVAALRDVLGSAIDKLRDDSRLHRVLVTTFVHGTPTQEAAADRLGLPFSTYRRHLTRGMDRLGDALWERELHG
ncbi:AAA family ATPase [Micromonospora sp. NBC_01813]|uniref:AAA family ATPase n=1 Tax=Micromonospora sp. NBC_01813 TaxID=2975988 RepID=UPI002DD7DC77|nr:AAA family ATPase [Micromonospora sp. NBC_01813]WSA07790.1 AAA family ATPase [Micromonospora sp. NBC_01813]